MVLDYKNEDDLRSNLLCEYLGLNYGLIKSPDPVILLTKECYEKYILYIFKNQQDMSQDELNTLINESHDKIKRLFKDAQLAKDIKKIATNFMNVLILKYNISEYILIAPKIQIPAFYNDVNLTLNISACFMKRKSKTKEIHYVSFLTLLNRVDPLTDVPTLIKIKKLNEINYRKNAIVYLDLYDADLPLIIRTNMYFPAIKLSHKQITLDMIKEKHVKNADAALKKLTKQEVKIPMCQNFYCPIRKECQNE
ncbi:hypothetical protein UFOVP724_133 [uncultured Caudovirales phage]|uniref:Uncharacterized protein n=1 Tax=uncultured Caudovirales phage TaxID=2100421 RepID=A0A6J5NT48_9CAUD|nr:hypothetical protein UFOVP724_133 [uncultured Caudovirales phage]